MDHERNPAAPLRTLLLRVRQLLRAVVFALLLIGLTSAVPMSRAFRSSVSPPCPGDYFSGPVVPSESIMADFNPGGAVSPLILAFHPSTARVLAVLAFVQYGIIGAAPRLPPASVQGCLREDGSSRYAA